jgi:hypothetical protein
MDAKGFDFSEDDPLSRVCKHCAWWDKHATPSGSVTLCANLSQHSHLAYEETEPDHTCDHWEERK